MTQGDIDAYVAAHNLTPIDPADAGIENAYISEQEAENDYMVRNLYGFKVGNDTICQQRYRDVESNYQVCLAMLKDNVDALE